MPADLKEAIAMARIRLILAAVMLGTLMLVPATAQAAKSSATLPVTGTGITTLAGAPVTFAGQLTIDRFVRQGGQILAIGSLTGTVTDAAGMVVGTVTNLPVRLPIFGITATCQVLHLELGPLDLDLLGLKVHLDKIVLDITAVSGPGNLLGNLLCAIAGLLDAGGPLGGLTALLNQLLSILG
jgi:hypothetical protein